MQSQQLLHVLQQNLEREQRFVHIGSDDSGSAGAIFQTLAAGKWYFEIEVIDSIGELCVGFAGTNFSGDSVGMDAASWGIGEEGFPCTK